MARIKVATSADVDDVQTQVSTLETTVTAPTTGLNAKVSDNETALASLNSTVGADDTSGLRKRVSDNEAAIGGVNSGLIKGQNDLVSTVGADNTQGLQKRVVDLETSVGTDDTTGLRKDSVDLKAKTDGYTYNGTTERITQVTAPTVTANDDKDLLTKKDGDALYRSTASGYFQESDTENDTWETICELDGVEIQARNPTTATDPCCQVVNNTGATLTHVWDIINNDNTIVEGATGNSSGSAFTLTEPPNESGARRRAFVSAYTNGNETGNGAGAWIYQVVMKRIGTTGYRVVATISAN